MTRLSWVAPRAWLSFIELDKPVVLVWLDWLVFCDYGFSVSALWCPLATPTVLLGFLLPWTWGISSWLLQLSAGAVPYLGQGVWIYRFIKLIESAIILRLAFLLCDLKEKKKWTSIWLHCSKVAAKESDTEAIKNNPEVKKSIQNQVTVEDRKTPVVFPWLITYRNYTLEGICWSVL